MSTANVQTSESPDSGKVERRERLHVTISSLIELRQKVIVKYCELSGLSSFDDRGTGDMSVNAEQLRRFCQVLVDYTAMGHFEIYQRIIEGKERRSAVREAAAEVYPGIAETTDYLVAFNDKYDSVDETDGVVRMLSEELSKLGEVIAVRGELEDKLLEALRQ